MASGSPRRAKILTSVGWEFTTQAADIDESEVAGEDAATYVRRLALEKAETIARLNQNQLVLGADTTVVVDGQILAKPTDLDDARLMLGRLAGRWHEVLTGVSIVRYQMQDDGEKAQNPGINNLKSKVGIQQTQVKFSALSESEMDYLVLQGVPLDKAGAYAVQEHAALFIEEIRGDHWNIVGLPIHLVYNLVQDFE